MATDAVGADAEAIVHHARVQQITLDQDVLSTRNTQTIRREAGHGGVVDDAGAIHEHARTADAGIGKRGDVVIVTTAHEVVRGGEVETKLRR
mgnify:CR=1 FL=1